MRTNHLILFALSITLFSLSCSKEAAQTGTPAASDGIVTIRVSIPEMTKVNGAYDGSVLALTWAAGDKIIISDHANSAASEEFTLVSGEGGKEAVFQGKALSASSYDILYSNLPSGFAAQTQSADKNTDHLGYSLSLVGVDSYDEVSFTSDWAASKGGSLVSSGALHLSATLPEGVAAVVSGVSLEASESIFAGAKNLSVTLGTPGDGGSDGILDIFASLPAGETAIPAGTTLLVSFATTDEAHSVYTRYYKVPSAISLKEGKLSLISLDCTNTATHAGSASDDGSAAHPYLIADKYQFQAIKDADSEKSFKLVRDIDLAGFSWTSLDGNDDKIVYLNGDGKTVSGLKAPLFSFFNGKVSDLTITDAEISSTKNYFGVLCRTIDKGTAEITGVSVRNSTVSTSAGAAFGGLIGRVDVDCSALTLTGCSATDITVNGYGHYAGGLIAYINVPNVTIQRCCSSGTVTTAAGSGRHVGGLVGGINTGGATITDSYSTCTIHGYQFIGGLVGSVLGSITVERCYSAGEVSATKGNAGLGGLVGTLQTKNGSIVKSAAWNNKVAPPSTKIGLGNYSSGAVVGVTHPNCVLTDNYRNPDMQLTAYWVPSANYDHPNVNGTTAPLVRIGTDLVEANAAPATETSISGDYGRWAYHGKHVASGTKLSTLASTTLGWSSSVWDFSGDTPTLK